MTKKLVPPDQEPKKPPRQWLSPSWVIGVCLLANFLLVSSSDVTVERRTAAADDPPTFKAGNGDYCPDDHWEETKIPFDDSNLSNFARIDTSDRAGGGMCNAFAMADKLSADLKLEGCWPKDNIYKKGASVLDLELQAYLIDTKTNPEKRSLKDFLTHNHGRDPSFYVDIVKDKGLCPEAAFLSEFHTGDNIDSIANVINELESQLKRAATGASTPVGGFCSACQRVSPAMSIEDQKELLGTIRKSDRSDAAFFNAFLKIDEQACKNRRIKLSQRFVLDRQPSRTTSDQEMRVIDEHLRNGETAYLHMDAADIYRLAPEGSAHAVVIVGATDSLKVRDGYGKPVPANKIGCYYALKNAWGIGLCEKKIVLGTVENPDVVCASKTGVYFVSKLFLKRQIIENRNSTPFVSSGLDLSDPKTNPNKCVR